MSTEHLKKKIIVLYCNVNVMVAVCVIDQKRNKGKGPNAGKLSNGHVDYKSLKKNSCGIQPS